MRDWRIVILAVSIAISPPQAAFAFTPMVIGPHNRGKACFTLMNEFSAMAGRTGYKTTARFRVSGLISGSSVTDAQIIKYMRESEGKTDKQKFEVRNIFNLDANDDRVGLYIVQISRQRWRESYLPSPNHLRTKAGYEATDSYWLFTFAGDVLRTVVEGDEFRWLIDDRYKLSGCNDG